MIGGQTVHVDATLIRADVSWESLVADHTERVLDEQAHIVVVSYNQIVLVAGQVPTEELRARAIKKISEIQKISKI